MARRKHQRESKTVKLPVSRIKTIMKSSPEVENIGKDALFLVNKATELFIQYLAESAFKIADDKKELHYKDIAEIVQTYDTMSFLREIMPRQITFGEYKELMVARGIPIEYESSEEEEDGDVDNDGPSESKYIRTNDGERLNAVYNDGVGRMEDREEEEEEEEEEEKEQESIDNMEGGNNYEEMEVDESDNEVNQR